MARLGQVKDELMLKRFISPFLGLELNKIQSPGLWHMLNDEYLF